MAMKLINFYISEEMLKRLRDVLGNKGKMLSETLRTLVENYIDKEESKIK